MGSEFVESNIGRNYEACSEASQNLTKSLSNLLDFAESDTKAKESFPVVCSDLSNKRDEVNSLKRNTETLYDGLIKFAKTAQNTAESLKNNK